MSSPTAIPSCSEFELFQYYVRLNENAKRVILSGRRFADKEEIIRLHHELETDLYRAQQGLGARPKES